MRGNVFAVSQRPFCGQFGNYTLGLVIARLLRVPPSRMAQSRRCRWPRPATSRGWRIRSRIFTFPGGADDPVAPSLGCKAAAKKEPPARPLNQPLAIPEPMSITDIFLEVNNLIRTNKQVAMGKAIGYFSFASGVDALIKHTIS